MAAWTVAPTLPADNSENISINPTFTWIKTDNGDPEPRIRLVVADNIGLTNPILDIYFVTEEEYELLKIDLDNITDYYWGVAIEEAAPTAVFKFTTENIPPTLLAPLDDATDVILQPTLSWQSNDGSTAFDLQLSETADFSGAEGVDQWTYTNIVAEEYTLTSNLPISTVIYWRVRVYNATVDPDWTTGGDSFTTAAGVPATPILTLPVDTDTDVSLNDLFTWAEASDATSYDIYFDTALLFTDPTIINTTDLEYRATSGLLLNSTLYYWKVVAKNNSGETASATRSFTTIAATVPAKPIPVDAGDTPVSNLPVLTWGSVEDAVRYRVEISTASDFSDIVEEDIAVTGTSYQVVSELDDDTTYYWRVKGVTELVGGSWSATSSFVTDVITGAETPEWVYPIDSTVNVSTLTPTLEWTDTANTDRWELRVYLTSGLICVIDESISKASGPEYVVPSGIFTDGESYSARVRSVTIGLDRNLYSEWVEVLFTIYSLFTDSAPLLTSPTQGETGVNDLFTAEWTFDHAGTDVTYRVQVATPNNLGNPLLEVDGIVPLELAINLSAFEGHNYWIRVRAEKEYVNPKGTGSTESLWSVIHTFVTDVSDPPPTPVIIYPEDESTVAIPVFCFWTGNPSTTDSYQLQISTNSIFTDIIYDNDDLTTIQDTIEGLDYNTTYYVRVRGYSNSYSGGYGSWSDVSEFTTEDTALPGPLTLVTPSLGKQGVSLTPLFEWTQSQYATYHILEIATDTSFSVSSVIYRSGSVAGINLTLPALNALDTQTTYFWRVKGVNTNGNSNWYSRWFVTTEAELPQTPTLVLPINYSGDVSREPLFTWKEEGITTAVTYIIEIALDAGFLTGVTEIENIPNLYLDFSDIDGDVVSIEPIEFNTQYYWRVRGVNVDSSNGSWSETFTFLTRDIPAPLKPIIITPTYASEVTKTSSIVFSEALFATYHKVMVSRDATFINPVIDEDVTGASLEVELDYGKTYYIRVQGIGRGGFGEFSDDLKITVESAP